MTGFAGDQIPPLQDFPPLGNNMPPTSNGHARQGPGPGRRGVSGDWRSNPAVGPTTMMAPRERAATTGMTVDIGNGAKSPPKSQYSRRHDLPQLTNPNRIDTSHVPCRFYPLGQCQAGNTCAFKHTVERMDAQCRYFIKVEAPRLKDAAVRCRADSIYRETANSVPNALFYMSFPMVRLRILTTTITT